MTAQQPLETKEPPEKATDPFIDPLTELEKDINQDFERQREGKLDQKTDSVSDDKANQGFEQDTDQKEADKSLKKDSPKEDASTEEYQTLSKKLDATNERLYENQRFARSLNQNKTTALKQIKDLIEEGELSEDQGEKLIAVLNASSVKEPESLSKPESLEENSHPFQKFFTIANLDVIQNYLEVSEDETYREKVHAFDAFMNEASQEELNDLYQELSSFEKEPMKLLKKMLSKGQQYLDEGFSEFAKAGGFRKYNSNKNSEIEILQRKVDKLGKKLLSYESYDKPTYRLDELNTDGSIKDASQSDDPLAPLFTYPAVGKANHRR